MATARKPRKAKRATPARRTVRKASRPSSKMSARRRLAAAKGRPKTKAKAPPRKQSFVASHLNPDAFAGGLRSYAKYRDLGMAAATNGLAQAHVIKMIPPCDPAVVSKRHYHDVEFQMIYVLKGWISGEYDGEIVTMREGSCWLQPPKIKHTVLDYSDDCELLEIILPAEFDTVELE
jgi:mannose-6-phosphate isomerase-like protein (cupin superfamily)